MMVIISSTRADLVLPVPEIAPNNTLASDATIMLIKTTYTDFIPISMVSGSVVYIPSASLGNNAVMLTKTNIIRKDILAIFQTNPFTWSILPAPMVLLTILLTVAESA